MEIHFKVPSLLTKSHIPFFLTFDKGILQIKDIYKLQGIAYTITGSYVQPYPYFSEYDFELSMDKDKKYFNETSILRRRKKRKELKIKSVIDKYEKLILDLQEQ